MEVARRACKIAFLLACGSSSGISGDSGSAAVAPIPRPTPTAPYGCHVWGTGKVWYVEVWRKLPEGSKAATIYSRRNSRKDALKDCDGWMAKQEKQADGKK